MKKKDFVKLAIIGMASGLCLTAEADLKDASYLAMQGKSRTQSCSGPGGCRGKKTTESKESRDSIRDNIRNSKDNIRDSRDKIRENRESIRETSCQGQSKCRGKATCSGSGGRGSTKNVESSSTDMKEKRVSLQIPVETKEEKASTKVDELPSESPANVSSNQP